MAQQREFKPVLKVTALVLRSGQDGDELLVFDHPLQEGGSMVQVPAGTIEPGEEPEDAVVRELLEETGVRGEITLFAGKLHEVYKSQYRRRWVYLMKPLHEVEDQWPHSCDCGMPVTCRWVPFNPTEVVDLQKPWVELGLTAQNEADKS